MRLTFWGAAGGEVTGSCYLLETGRARVLVDFGAHQGGPEAEDRNRQPPPLNAPNLDAVILTHAHLDHCGQLPLLEPAGLRCKIWATPATIDLVPIVLYDSAGIQEQDAEHANRRRVSEDAAEIKPLYTTKDVDGLMRHFAPLPYWEKREVAPGVAARLVDAGHIIGSASLELTITDGGAERVIVFSGDIGPRGAPLLRDPTMLERADILILESTYGDRDHPPREEQVRKLGEIVRAAEGGCGKVLIPAFAIGRTQDMIYEFGKMRRAGALASPVYIDSPMAIETTDLYRRHRELFDGEAWSIISAGDSPLRFDNLHYIRTSDESRKLNGTRQGAIVLAGSGMCTGGRIVFHLKHNLGDPCTQLVFVGYQAQGTLGRQLVDGADRVEIFREPVPVKAQVHVLSGFSAHAGQSGLVEFAASFRPKPKRVFLTHGENPQRQALAAKLKQACGIEAELPGYWQHVEL
jgi:metallo-beta-lactamase family protein